jgi:hypothetical protein
MQSLRIAVLLFVAGCAEAEEFAARPGDGDAGLATAGGTYTTGQATGGTGGGLAGRGIGGTDGQPGGSGGAGGSGGWGNAGSVAAGGAPDAGLGGAGGTGGRGGGAGSAGASGGGKGGSGGIAGAGGTGGGAPCSVGCALKVQYQNSTSPPEPMTSTVRVRVDVFNAGTKDVPLANVTVRYWFTDAGGSGDKATCYYAQDGCAAIATKFSPVTPPRARADRYLEIGFSGTGNLAPGAHTGSISIGVQHVAGGPLYDQTDDYSYGENEPNAVDWPKVTAYVGTSLSWGVEP